MEAKPRIVTIIEAMFDELEAQATINQTPHNFIYKSRRDVGIGKLIEPDEQIKLLFYLHDAGLIGGVGKDIYHEYPDGEGWYVEVEDKTFEKERELIKNPDFFAIKKTYPSMKAKKAEKERLHTLKIKLDGNTLFLKIDDFEYAPIARFREDSKMREIAAKLFSNEIGTVFRNVDFNFSRANRKTNLTQIFANGRYAHLLIFMDTTRLPRSISLKTKEITLPEGELKKFLTKINAKFSSSLPTI